ncbi:type II toxin-antitoxin system mRNA interferase toxin, RelE/StbE family [Candidatus Peregrinibacteria bacterium]|nr:type II toxin-antitoxin system mRNA interferase toxin, RelE/StbE family [Candidatus Peregrinibacteria bacterium]
MRIRYHKSFLKSYRKLDVITKGKVKNAIVLFCQNPKDVRLYNHGLKGRLFGKRAIKVTGDVRIIFEEYDDYLEVLFLDVGTHNQVY